MSGSHALFEQMNAAIAKAKLHPVIDRGFAFDQVQEASSTCSQHHTSARS